MVDDKNKWLWKSREEDKKQPQDIDKKEPFSGEAKITFTAGPINQPASWFITQPPPNPPTVKVRSGHLQSAIAEAWREIEVHQFLDMNEVLDSSGMRLYYSHDVRIVFKTVVKDTNIDPLWIFTVEANENT